MLQLARVHIIHFCNIYSRISERQTRALALMHAHLASVYTHAFIHSACDDDDDDVSTRASQRARPSASQNI